MQFYLNGYGPGDPDICAAAPAAEIGRAQASQGVDVLIVGSGPAGTLLAAQLSTFPGISTRLVERRKGPLQLGQADGVACRTVEMFEAFGLSAKLLRKGRFGLVDYEKVFCPDLKNGQDIFVLRGIHRATGAIVVVRPDQYVANVLPLDAHDELAAFFAGFMLDRR